jgi:hypothetical protein
MVLLTHTQSDNQQGLGGSGNYGGDNTGGSGYGQGTSGGLGSDDTYGSSGTTGGRSTGVSMPPFFPPLTGPVEQ